MNKHTPGPWRVDPEFPGDIQAEGTEIATTFSAPQVGVQLRILGPITVDLDTRLANARLIAAAPDMLAMLQEVADYLDCYADVIDGDDGQPEANDAMRLLTAVTDLIAAAK